MPETHPDEIELLELVEGERTDLADHVASCAECAERVRLLEAGRDALRAAPLLELPAERQAELIRRLPAQERERRFAWRPLAVVVALAALVATVAALAIVNSGGRTSEEGAGMAGGEAGGGAELAPTTAQDTGGDAAKAQPLASVAGDPKEVAADLRDRGFNARVRRDRVVVLSSDPEAVRTALAARKAGDVRVFVRNP
jgi:hypothetical protein